MNLDLSQALQGILYPNCHHPSPHTLKDHCHQSKLIYSAAAITYLSVAVTVVCVITIVYYCRRVHAVCHLSCARARARVCLIIVQL